MNILIFLPTVLPATTYGGTERAIWYLGKELTKLGHQVTFLVNPGSTCDFASVLFYNPQQPLAKQIPADIDLVHSLLTPTEEIGKPYLVTVQGNTNDLREFDQNTVFVSRNHANRYNSESFVYNGMDWDDYGKVDLTGERDYFHFLAKAAWRVKNVKGAIRVTRQSGERLKVLGGTRLNLKMGFRLTLDPRVSFAGMVGGAEKNRLLNGSKGLVFPVLWHEPFGIALTESLYFGCPVFGTPYGSLPELIPAEVGLLSDKAAELVEGIKNVGSYSRKVCHEYAVEGFNARVMTLRYLELYQKVLKGEPLNPVRPKLKQVQTEKFLPFYD
jgi:glycosyltransferase involved in cell wall biosynthesis